MKKLPKELFIVREGEGDDMYFLASEKLGELDDGEVGVYKLEKVGKKSTKTLIDFK